MGSPFKRPHFRATLAQLVEQHFRKVKVPGSNPGGGSMTKGWVRKAEVRGIRQGRIRLGRTTPGGGSKGGGGEAEQSLRKMMVSGFRQRRIGLRRTNPFAGSNGVAISWRI